MAAKIGILGESTATAIATITVYTVPASKAARVRILIAMEQQAAQTSGYSVQIGTPGAETNIVRAGAAGVDLFTGIPNAGIQSSRDIGLIEADMGGALTGTNVDRASLLPFPHDFFLSTGDTVKYQITTDTLQDHLIQVIGVEDDA